VEASKKISERSGTWQQLQDYEQSYQQAAVEMGVNQPIFYFSIGKGEKSEAFFNVVLPRYKDLTLRLMDKNVGFENTQSYIASIRNIEKQCYAISNDSSNILYETRALYYAFEKKDIEEKSISLEYIAKQDSTLQESIVVFLEKKKIIIAEYSEKIVWLPSVQWFGTRCQFHQWLKKTASGDFGISYTSYRPVQDEIRDAVRWTLLMSSLALIVVFSIGIWLGLKSAARFGQKWDTRLLRLTFFLDAIPQFWLATLILIFLTSSYYHLKIFPNAGIGNFSSDASFLEKAWIALPHFIAPIFCIVLTSISMIIRQMRASALRVLGENFIKTAKAKGLSNTQILSKHVFPNAIFPMIALFGASLPDLIMGSLTIETIFNIPGMGKLASMAIYEKNFPVLIAIVFLVALLTIVGGLVSDILYKIYEPKSEV
jgi:peptide/nickel transport system permease protein